MESSSSSKKRKICQVDGHDEVGDNEEEKIEKFFALIRSIREARDRLLRGRDRALLESVDNRKGKRRIEEEKQQQQQQVATWKPSFLREDFMEEEDRDQVKSLSAVTTMVDASDHRTKKGTDKEEIKESLNLRLSL
ncbi:hypothetical protein Tsubulata_003504 [Turnera subulata]|uniref:Uncharacterized protein n=1 Tax=Turnera subulata TaxID=218843 RepID=A0A9Q0G9A1_9ROSI|nr:hypothetical protein Tsubulata_003504 [Turnera subulata]